MHTQYRARWISRRRLEELRRSGRQRQGVVIDYYNGYLIVEPVGSDLGDGPILSPETADYELRPVWCLVPKAKLKEARRLLGLEAESMNGELVGAG
jgi:hypothetical protein